MPRKRKPVKSDKERSRSPFKRRDVLGPGPRGQKNVRADDWACKCLLSEDRKKTVCTCEGISSRTTKRDGTPMKKKVKINLAEKRKYQKVYREWKKKERERTRKVRAAWKQRKASR